jgi:hypothetical protein
MREFENLKMRRGNVKMWKCGSVEMSEFENVDPVVSYLFASKLLLIFGLSFRLLLFVDNEILRCSSG